MPISYLECAPRNRCRNYRRCEPCAQIRQAQVADVAQLGAMSSGAVTYAVVKTTSPTTISRDKAALQKHLQKTADGGIWTVETGEVAIGLHLNILIGSASALPADAIAAGWPVGGEIWAEEIAPLDVRNVAAYIAKRSSIPDRDEYAGRTYGSWGSWRRPLQIMAGQRDVPEIQALALDMQLWQAGVSAPTGADAPEINSDEQERKRSARFARVLAAAEGRVDVSGLAYVEGHGLKTRREIQGMRARAESLADA